MIPFYVFLFCLFVTYALYLLATRSTDARREQFQERLNQALLYSSKSNDSDVLILRDELMSEIPLVNRALLRLQVANRLKRLIGQADLPLTVIRLLLFCLIAGLVAGLAMMMIANSLLLVFFVALIAAMLPFMHVLWTRKKRLHKFLENLPDSLELMSRALSAGHSFTSALQMVSTEMPDPISTEFRRTYDEQNLGLSLKLALDNLAERIPLIDLRLCITAVLIQRETGGNLAEILERVADTIRDRFRIMEDLKTLTAQSRIGSWILCSLPVFIAVTITWLHPKYMEPLWTDPRGNKIIAAILFFQVAGMLMIRKIMRIKV